MSASTAPTAKANLLTLLKEDTGMAGVQIEYADPGRTVQQEAVWFEETILDETARALGQQRRDESYALKLIVFVVQDGDDAQAVETRAWALVAVVENLLRPPTGPGGAVSANLSGAVNLWAVFESCEMVPFTVEGQRGVEAVCTIRCKSRK